MKCVRQRGWRRQVLDKQLTRLERLAERHDTKVLIHHLFECVLFDPLYSGPEQETILDDEAYWRQSAGDASGDGRPVYAGPDEEASLYDAYLAEQGHAPGD
ncbi:MAG: hypothetical protein KJ621_12235 [Proteobacteria bacterium]|nr:hypothetical protein [Pseudomonadota bacterium]